MRKKSILTDCETDLCYGNTAQRKSAILNIKERDGNCERVLFVVRGCSLEDTLRDGKCFDSIRETHCWWQTLLKNQTWQFLKNVMEMFLWTLSGDQILWRQIEFVFVYVDLILDFVRGYQVNVKLTHTFQYQGHKYILFLK